jgi:hypothetical protein
VTIGRQSGAHPEQVKPRTIKKSPNCDFVTGFSGTREGRWLGQWPDDML